MSVLSYSFEKSHNKSALGPSVTQRLSPHLTSLVFPARLSSPQKGCSLRQQLTSLQMEVCSWGKFYAFLKHKKKKENKRVRLFVE